jgi:hypothetical protein
MIKIIDQRRMQSKREKFVFSLPFIVFVCLYGYSVLQGKRFDGTFIGNSNFINFLSLDILRSDLFSALMGMHSQPPLLNFIFGLAAQLYPHQVLAIQILWLCVFLLTIYCIEQSLRILIESKIIASVGTILYIFLPSTFGYVFWAYNTILLQMSFSVLILGIIRLWKNIKWGTTWTCLGLFLLFSIKTSFSGLIIIPVMLLVGLHYLRAERKNGYSKVELVLISFLLICSTTVQAHYVIDFKISSLSSWSSNHLWRNLSSGLSPAQKIEIGKTDRCFADIIQSENSGLGLHSYPNCLDKYQYIEVKTNRAASLGNTMNSKDRLLGSFAVRDLVNYSLPRYWTAYSKSVFGNSQTPGSLSNFLGVAIYTGQPRELVKQNLLLIFCILLVLMYLVILSVYPRRYFSKYLCVLIGIFLFGLTYSLFGESMENDRYKVEMNPLMFVLSISICKFLYDAGLFRKILITERMRSSNFHRRFSISTINKKG